SYAPCSQPEHVYSSDMFDIGQASPRCDDDLLPARAPLGIGVDRMQATMDAAKMCAGPRSILVGAPDHPPDLAT
ncbi:MAG: hypothetical protein WAK18_08695, partial [Nocardioidaceae bacterium]